MTSIATTCNGEKWGESGSGLRDGGSEGFARLFGINEKWGQNRSHRGIDLGDVEQIAGFRVRRAGDRGFDLDPSIEFDFTEEEFGQSSEEHREGKLRESALGRDRILRRRAWHKYSKYLIGGGIFEIVRVHQRIVPNRKLESNRWGECPNFICSRFFRAAHDAQQSLCPRKGSV